MSKICQRDLLKEEKIQRALGTLPSYYIRVQGPRGGLLGSFNVEAVTPARAIKSACSRLCYGVQKRFLPSHRLSWEKSHRPSNCCSVYIRLDNVVAYGQHFGDLRAILDIDGNICKNIQKEILKKLDCVQTGVR